MERARVTRRALMWWAGPVALVVSAVFLVRAADLPSLKRTWDAALSAPVALGLVLALYAAAFLVRAVTWCRTLPGLSLGHSLAALHVSLLGNHVLPLRLGEALRVTSVVRRARIPVASATASTVLLRAADVLAVAVLATAFSPDLVDSLIGGWSWVLMAFAVALWGAGAWWLRRLRRDRRVELRTSTLLVSLAAPAAWVLESAVVWQAARWAGMDISFPQAILVTAVTIAAQVVAITPGGIGTYEAAATASFVALGYGPEPAFAAAVTAHAIKTAYSLVTGGAFLFVPSPSAFGRLRLDTSDDRVEQVASLPPGEGPVVLFMPAHNEEASIRSVIGRVPTRVRGHRVLPVVVDDGSTDRTGEVAAHAGADVLRLSENQGLGAAVRVGLQHGVDVGAAAIAFCDADGEYAPEELERLVAPILDGRADYVVGSRFRGTIEKMHPHRRFGNVVLTRLLRFVARRDISDGQSGYRAFSRSAAADADVIHDFNYAQVLTLDLLDKGYGYEEIPISYSFRTEGRSFIRLTRYLRHVIPAVHRELNPHN